MLADRLGDSPALREGFCRAARTGRGVLVSITRPARVDDAIAQFAQTTSRERTLWLRPSRAEAIVGLGAAHVIAVEGPDRFRQAREAWAALLDDALVDDAAQPWCGPLLLGGFRFDPLRPPTALWPEPGCDRLVLPKRQYVERDGQAWLTTNHFVGPPPGVLARPAGPRAVRRAELGMPSPAAWQNLVGSVARDIRGGTLGLSKVVLALARQVEAAAPFDPARVLGKLAEAYPTCTVFGQAHGDALFVGATPEVLVAVRDGTAATMALAGSLGRGATPDADRALGERLLHDPKERAEHAFVVDALRSGLAEVSTRVIADAAPRLRQLSNVQHLLTRVRGELAPGRGILDVVERLHPTPAMGGVPRDQALTVLRERECLDRGWYAGPLGWTNQVGEGEFVVAIRSALLRGASATLFAGCGIVADSDPAAEYAEWGWKLRPMLAALEVDADL